MLSGYRKGINGGNISKMVFGIPLESGMDQKGKRKTRRGGRGLAGVAKQRGKKK